MPTVKLYRLGSSRGNTFINASDVQVGIVGLDAETAKTAEKDLFPAFPASSAVPAFKFLIHFSIRPGLPDRTAATARLIVRQIASL